MGAGNVPIWYWAQARDGAGTSCLIVHGVGEHSGRYTHVAEALGNSGVTVWALDYRGHGRSGGRRGHCRAVGELMDDVGRVLGQMRAECPSVPIVLLGHSLGGLVVLRYALDHAQELAAVVASSPALELALSPSYPKLLLARVFGKLWPRLTVRNDIDPTWLSHDPAVVTAYRTDPLVHHVISIGGYLAIRQAMAHVRARAADLSVPCLILQAGEDRLVSAPATRQFAAQVRSPGSAYREYPGYYHELFNEVGREQVLSDLCAWLTSLDPALSRAKSRDSAEKRM